MASGVWHDRGVTHDPVQRLLIDTIRPEGDVAFASVEVRRITMAPDVGPGAHWHNGPVFGVIEAGSVTFAVDGGPETVLRAGDTFFEPAATTIDRFDAQGDGVTFVAWFPLPAGAQGELVRGPYR